MQNKFLFLLVLLLVCRLTNYSINYSKVSKLETIDTSSIEIQFKDTFGKKVSKGFVILINNKEDFQIEFAKNEIYRKYTLDKNGIIYIKKKEIRKYFLEGMNSISAIYLYKNKPHRFDIDLGKNALVVLLNPS